MSDSEMKDAWEILTGEEKLPTELLSIIGEYKRRMSAFYPTNLSMGDFVNCTMLYSIMFKGKKKNV